MSSTPRVAGDSRPHDLFESRESQLRYEAYSRLQAAAVAFGDSCSLPIPEIVAIGGQSDGKSSLMEAFLGVSGVQLLHVKSMLLVVVRSLKHTICWCRAWSRQVTTVSTVYGLSPQVSTVVLPRSSGST